MNNPTGADVGRDITVGGDFILNIVHEAAQSSTDAVDEPIGGDEKIEEIDHVTVDLNSRLGSMMKMLRARFNFQYLSKLQKVLIVILVAALAVCTGVSVSLTIKYSDPVAFNCLITEQCQNGGTCVDTVTHFQCNCPLGFTGITCADILDIESGTDSELLHKSFDVFHNSSTTNIRAIEQKLKCGLNPCLNGGKCFLKNNELHCECLAGFHGANCETDIDDCAGHSNCLNSGTCVEGTRTFSCACAQGFIGNHCEINIDDCAGPSHCLNSGTCVDGANSYTCACPEEFFGKHCEHQNECVYPGTCASVGNGAKCKCREGYAPDQHDSRRCEPANKNLNENATLIFGSYGEGIEQFSLSQQTVTRIQNDSQVSYALDVMYRTNTMFWSDFNGNINTAPVLKGAPMTVVLNDSGSRILSLAVDWIYDHLYFADDTRNTISVTNLDGSMKKVLFTTRVTETRAIVVDPLSGWIYWADWTVKNIERAGMDGTQREVIANLEPKFPLGLTLDMSQNRLYWTTQFHPASIHSMNADGSDKKLVFQATLPTFLNSQFRSITTFGDFVYWRDHPTKAVYRTNKCGGDEATAIYLVASENDAYRPLKAFHFSKQPVGVNYCKNRIGGQCSHLCFRIPSKGNQSVSTTCACPDGRILSPDQLTCT